MAPKGPNGPGAPRVLPHAEAEAGLVHTDARADVAGADPEPKEVASITQMLNSLPSPALSIRGARRDEQARRTALLICRDADAVKWGPRWLGQYGLEPVLCDDPDAALEIVRSTEPCAVVVEAGMQDSEGRALVSLLQRDEEHRMPVVALCPTSKDLCAALDAGAFDIVRKPYDWRLVAERIRHAAERYRLEADLRRAEESLSQALTVADETRRLLKSRESVEPVTGLPNRKRFVELLRRTVATAGRNSTRVAVFVIGFNRFRLVTEAMGQERAELVLAGIGKSLNDCLLEISSRPSGPARLRTAAAASIDHARFAVMLTCAEDGPDDLASVQRQLVERLSRPAQIAGQTVYLTACVGVAIFPQDADGADRLLQRAANAMRDAQSRGGGFRFYCTETDAAATRKLKLEHMLHEALDADELSLAYQPIVDVARGRVSGAEALLRWRHAGAEFISPTEFVPIAEESGLMNRVGEYVLEETCRQLAEWNAAGLVLPHICVNVSKVQLTNGRLVDIVSRLLAEYDLDPACLELELSERGVLSGDYQVISQLHDLKSLGVRLSLDDFGTGDSTIVYLKELPIDVIKIDRSYVHGINEDPKDAAIVSAMVALGQRLGLKVIAEGVETAEQLETLKRLGCDEYQGFIVSEPLMSRDLVRFLTRNEKQR